MRRTIFPAVLLATAIALAGCSAAGGSSTDSVSGAGAPGPVTDSRDGVAGEQAGGDQAVNDADRQVVISGYVTITAADPLDAATEAVRIAESVGGRVDGRTEYAPVDGDKGSATLTLRLPADDLTRTLDRLKELGEVEEVSLNSDDVTMESQDLDARINALTASVERLTALIATATDTEVLIQLETAISDRQAELESLQAQRRYLADQVSLSTITLNLISEDDAPVDNPDTFLSGLVTGWEAFLAFFAGLAVALGVLLPWLVFAGLIAAATIFIIRRRRSLRLSKGTPEVVSAP